MAVVRLRDDLYERITKLAVKTTLAIQEPVRQAELINMIVDMVLEDYTVRDLITQYHKMKALENDQEPGRQPRLIK